MSPRASAPRARTGQSEGSRTTLLRTSAAILEERTLPQLEELAAAWPELGADAEAIKGPVARVVRFAAERAQYRPRKAAL